MDRAQQDIARQEAKARDVNAKKKQVGIVCLLVHSVHLREVIV